MKKLGFFTLTALLLGQPVWASDDEGICARGLRNLTVKERRFDDSLWERKDQILVKAGNQSLPITLSLDSEIPVSDLHRYIVSRPSLLKEVGRFLPRGSWFPHYSVDELSLELKMSEKQVRRFVIRNGVDKNQDRYDIWDLNSAFFAHFFVRQPFRNDWIKNSIRTVLRNIKKEGFPFDAHFDSDFELTYETWETNPSEYRKVVRNLHSIFRNAATHFHVGIPTIVPMDKVMSIGRAIETKIVFDRIIAKYVERLPFNLDSAHDYRFNDMSKKGFYFGRSVIRVDRERWDDPFPLHDIEIRQWKSLQDGLNNAALIIRLSQAHDRLKKIPYSKLISHREDSDPIFGNYLGALHYAGHLFLSSSKKDHQEIGKRIFRLQDQPIEVIRKFLIENRIDEKLEDPELYLEEMKTESESKTQLSVFENSRPSVEEFRNR